MQSHRNVGRAVMLAGLMSAASIGMAAVAPPGQGFGAMPSRRGPKNRVKDYELVEQRSADASKRQRAIDQTVWNKAVDNKRRAKEKDKAYSRAEARCQSHQGAVHAALPVATTHQDADAIARNDAVRTQYNEAGRFQGVAETPEPAWMEAVKQPGAAMVMRIPPPAEPA